MNKLPPGSRIPKDLTGLRALGIEQYEVGSWCPTPDGSGPATQVHMVLTLAGCDPDKVSLVMRFKTAFEVDRMIAALQRHRADVWPTP